MQLRILGLVLLAACGPGDGGGAGGGGADAAIGDQPDAASGSFPDAASCASTRKEADEALAPVDIIWVVDSSGSMSNEEAAVQNALNDFSNFIDQSGIDYHVILIGDAGSMNVPPPLGGSARFLHVNQTISSTNALQQVHATYSQYQSFLRDQATLHIVVVTDDESDWSPSQFNTSIAGLSNPGLRSDYVMHAICSEEVAIITPPPPLPPVMGACSGGLGTGGAAEPGLRYIEMVNATGGVWKSICTSNWTPIFTAVAQAVSVGVALPCTFDLPDPPMGESLDPDRVNFVFTPSGGGNPLTVPRVTDQAACGSGPGWYYDDPAMPAQIFACPATCSILEGDPNGSVEIEFGCASVVL